MKDKIKINHNKIVWFSEEQIMNTSIKFMKEPLLKDVKSYKKEVYHPNEYIKFQHLKRVRNYWRRKDH